MITTEDISRDYKRVYVPNTPFVPPKNFESHKCNKFVPPKNFEF